MGISFQQIQKYERGFNRMSLSRAWEIAEILGISVADLFDGAASAVPDIDFTSPGFVRWIALYNRAHRAGCASLLSGIAAEFIALYESAVARASA